MGQKTEIVKWQNYILPSYTASSVSPIAVRLLLLQRYTEINKLVWPTLPYSTLPMNPLDLFFFDFRHFGGVVSDSIF